MLRIIYSGVYLSVLCKVHYQSAITVLTSKSSVKSFMNTLTSDCVSHKVFSKSWGTSSQSHAVVPDFWLDDLTSWHFVLFQYTFFIKNLILFLIKANFIKKQTKKTPQSCNTWDWCIIDNFAVAQLLMNCEWQRSTNRLSLAFNSIQNILVLLISHISEFIVMGSALLGSYSIHNI